MRAIVLGLLVGCSSEEVDPDVGRALYTCGQPSPGAAIIHLRAGRADVTLGTGKSSLRIVDQGQSYPRDTCTAWPMGFFTVPGKTRYRLECDRYAPQSLALELEGLDPRTLALGTLTLPSANLHARIEAPCNRPGDPCDECELDPNPLRVTLNVTRASGASAPDPTQVTSDYARTWTLRIDGTTTGPGACAGVTLAVELSLEQSALDYRWLPSRAQPCAH